MPTIVPSLGPWPILKFPVVLDITHKSPQGVLESPMPDNIIPDTHRDSDTHQSALAHSHNSAPRLDPREIATMDVDVSTVIQYDQVCVVDFPLFKK